MGSAALDTAETDEYVVPVGVSVGVSMVAAGAMDRDRPVRGGVSQVMTEMAVLKNEVCLSIRKHCGAANVGVRAQLLGVDVAEVRDPKREFPARAPAGDASQMDHQPSSDPALASGRGGNGRGVAAPRAATRPAAGRTSKQWREC